MKTKSNISSVQFEKINKEFLKNNVSIFLDMIKNWKYGDWKEDNFLCDLPLKWDYSFVCKSDDDIIGFCFNSGKIAKCLYIHLLFINEANRSRNIGKLLIDNLKIHALENELEKIALCCPKDNISGLNFYLKNKFEVIPKDSIEEFYLEYEV